MKITKLTLYPVQPRWLFLKIDTDEGISGWGEPVIEGKADTVAACVREMEPYILGKDPRNIEDIWQVLPRCFLPWRPDHLQRHFRHRAGALGY